MGFLKVSSSGDFINLDAILFVERWQAAKVHGRGITVHWSWGTSRTRAATTNFTGDIADNLLDWLEENDVEKVR